MRERIGRFLCKIGLHRMEEVEVVYNPHRDNALSHLVCARCSKDVYRTIWEGTESHGPIVITKRDE